MLRVCRSIPICCKTFGYLLSQRPLALTRPHPTNEAEFEALMEWVDSRLREDGTSIPGRPSRAMSILAVELREPFVTPYPERALLEGCYTGDDLTMRVEEWFDRRYGERLKIDMSPGRAVILIRNDPWVLKLPLIVGTWEIVTEDPPRGRLIISLGLRIPARRRTSTTAFAAS
jgi:hypothetical protein